jgi:hypothetical protein
LEGRPFTINGCPQKIIYKALAATVGRPKVESQTPTKKKRTAKSEIYEPMDAIWFHPR